MEREPLTPAEDDKKKRKLRAPLPGVATGEAPESRPVVAEASKDDKPARDLAKLFERTGMDVAGEPTQSAEKTDDTPKEVAEAPAVAEEVEVPLDGQAEQADTPEVPELSADEQREAATRLVEARAEEVTTEQQASPAGTPAATAATQAGAFLQAVDGRLQQGEAPDVATAGAYEDVTGEAAPPFAEAEPDSTSPLDGGAPAGGEQPPDDDSAANPYAAGGAGGRRGGWTGRFTAGVPGWAGGARGMNTAPGTQPEQVVVSGVASGLLVGGIVGYLLGRRRGRIRTERELLPVQKKLEKEVQALSDNLALREAQVRQLTWERAATGQPESASVANAQEAAPAVRVERPAPAKQEAAKLAPKTVEQLHLNEVLKISETIVIGSTTIRKVFETNLISERGLRRVVDEHLNGGDVRKVLTEELLIKEMSHELDPQLRDRGPEPVVAAGTTDTAPQVTIAEMPAEAPLGSMNSMVTPSMPAAHDFQERSVSPMLVVANIIALVILAALLVTLLVVWLLHQ